MAFVVSGRFLRSRVSSLLVVVSLGALWAGCGATSNKKTIPLGEACTPGDTTLVCADELCLALDNQSGFCTRTCNDDCPEGFFCQGAGRYGRVCKRLGGCKEETDCPAGHTCNTETGNCYIKVSRGLCSPCQDVTQCPEGGACFTALASGEQFCTTACGAGDSCPNGFECQTIPAGKNGADIKQCVPSRQTCNIGKPVCAACSGDDECGGPFDLCVRNVVSGETFCSRDCNPRKNVCPPGAACDPESLDSAQNPDCPTGFSCTNIGKSDDPTVKGPHQCVPNSNTCAGYCNSSTDQTQLSQCGLGKVCVNNRCQPAVDGRECSPCTNNDDCRVGGFTENRCLVNNCPDCEFKGESFCATPCANTDACVRSFGAGFVCQQVNDSSGVMRSYCMPQRGTCKTGLGPLGADCKANGAKDCVSGVCLVAGLAQFCSAPCTTDTQCGDVNYRCCESSAKGYDCSPSKRTATGPVSGSGVCAPLGGLFGDDCSPGRSPCQSGTCLDLGTARVCSVTCANGSCPDNFTCRKAQIPDSPTQLDICFPNGGGKPGASCSFGPAACDSGLCIRKDSGPICTQGCATDTDCPSGWICDALYSVTNQSVQACLPPALQGG